MSMELLSYLLKTKDWKEVTEDVDDSFFEEYDFNLTDIVFETCDLSIKEVEVFIDGYPHPRIHDAPIGDPWLEDEEYIYVLRAACADQPSEIVEPLTGEPLYWELRRFTKAHVSRILAACPVAEEIEREELPEEHEEYWLHPFTNPDGEHRYYIEMDPKFIEPVKDELMSGPLLHDVLLGELVTSGSKHNFPISIAVDVMKEIEKVIKKAGLRIVGEEEDGFVEEVK